jgi:hypothetical protein
MDNEGLDKPATLYLPVGHLLVVWDILSNRLSETPYKDEFTEEEKRAIWALEDLCEKELVRNGFGARPEEQWNKLINQATEFVKTIPVEFLD